MNWRFCVYTPEQRALKLCRGSMNEGSNFGHGYGSCNGYGYGDGYGAADGRGFGAGYGVGNGDGYSGGWVDGDSPVKW